MNSGIFSTIGQMTLMGLRYLNGRKLRTTLTTLAIVFGVAMIFAINLTLPPVMNTFSRSMSSLTGADLSVASVSGESFAPEAVLQTVAGVDGVQAVTGILHRSFNKPGTTEQVDFIGIDAATIEAVHPFNISQGRFFTPNERGVALLPANVAELDAALQIGSRFPLITAGGLKIYEVVGWVADLNSAAQIYVPLADAQAAFNQADRINTIEVALKPNADRVAVGEAVQKALGDSFMLNTAANGTDTLAAAQLGMTILTMMGMLSLFLGAFLIFNTFRTVVVERRHDIGMLRSIGATKRQVTLLIVIESLLQGIIGSLLGLLVGYLLAVVLFNYLNPVLGSMMGHSAMSPVVDAMAIGSAMFMGLLTAMLAGYWPARSAGKITPIEALRAEAVVSVQKNARRNLIIGGVVMVLSVGMLMMGSKFAANGAMLFIVGMLVASPDLVIPVARLFSPLLSVWFNREGDLARGNLERQPGRAAITGSTLMIGLAVLVLMTALVASFGVLVTNLANRNFSSDIILLPPTIAVYNNVLGADESLAARLRELPDVAAVGSIRYAASKTGGQALQVLGIDPVEYPKVASFEFTQGTAEQSFADLASGRNVIMSPLGLSALKLTVGDEVALQTPDGSQTYKIVGVASDIMTFKVAVAFVSQANLLTDFHKAEDVMLMLNVAQGADKSKVAEAVKEVVKDYPQFTVRLTGEYRDELIEITNGAFSLFYAIAAIILIPAALGLLNTMTINVLERTREIGIVRAVGGSRKQVRRMVTAEALLLGIFSAAMGVFAGVAMSYGFISAFGSIGWEMPVAFPLAGIIAAIIVGVLLALFAAVLPARNAAKLDIIKALQYE